MSRIGYAARTSEPRPGRAVAGAGRGPAEVAPRDGSGRGAPAPCSFAQEQFWFVDQLAPGNVAYHFSWPVRLRGPLDAPALTRALHEVVRRHEALRTHFALEDGRPVQVLDAADAFGVQAVDVSAEARPEEAASRIVAAEGRRPFDLSRGPLFRAHLIRLGDADHILQIVVHHSVFDERSKFVLYRELGELYRAYAAGDPSPLSEPALQYAHFAAWQRAGLTGEALEGALAHWTGELEDVPTVLELPTDRPRPPLASLGGARLRMPLPDALTASLRELAEAEGGTFFEAVLALFEVLLYRYSAQADFVVGVPVDDRTVPELDDVVGVLLSTLVLRSDLSDMPSFRTLLTRVRRRVLDAAAHAELPFQLLVRELQPVRDLSRHPLFQVLLAINPAEPELRLPGIEAEELEGDGGAAAVDLFLFLQERAEGLQAIWQYSPDLFDRDTIERIHGHFLSLAAAAVQAPDQPIDRLPLLAAQERERLLVTWQGERVSYPEAALHTLIEAQVARAPAATAVDFAGEQLSYAELDARANQLARHLRGLGAGKGSLVAVCMERSLELVVGLLAVLKAGAAYVPLDPELPPDRMSFMLSDCSAPVVLTQERLLDRLAASRGSSQASLLCLDTQWPQIAAQSPAALDAGVGPDDVAYVIYTSGSTGRPKGVLNTHRGIVNRLLAMQDTYRLDAADRLLQKTPISFDVSVREVFWPLLFGARLIVAAPGEHGNPAHLVELIEREGVTTIHFVPSMLALFIEEADPARCGSLRSVLSGGEALVPELARRFFERFDCELHNLYGPTEAAVSVTTWRCRPGEEAAVMPLGRPIANTQIYAVDSRLEPVPVGAWGELLIGGAQVARGYLGRPELTAERFVPNPFGPGRVYRTGDRGRFSAEGVLEFGGRIDDQVKLRGFRIELGEIEAVLCEHDAVAASAVVVAQSAGGRRELAAYVVPAPTAAELSGAEVRAFLLTRLPDYMVPSSVTLLDELPLSPSGKLDRRALPAPDRAEAQDDYVEPQGSSERALARLWGELLEIERVGRSDNFFTLGGDSLLAARVISRLSKEFDVTVPLCVFLQGPTVAELARELEADRRPAEPELPPLRSRATVRECSFAQERFWFVEQLMGASAAYNIPVTLRLSGELRSEALEHALTEIVRRHEVLRTRFSDDEGRPVQVIERPFRVAPERVDLDGVGAEREQEARRLINELTQTPFEVSRDGTLFRVALLRLDERTHILHMVFSHLVFDGFSKLVLLREVGALYDAAVRGARSPLPELGIQFADFAEWQRSWLQGELLDGELAHWTAALEGIPDGLELPTDRPRPPVASLRGAWSRCTMPGPTIEGLHALAGREGTTLYSALLAAFGLLLHRYSSQDDVLIGMPVEGRDRPELEDSIGVFVDTVVLRVGLSGNPTFRDLLGRVRTRVVDAIAHQRLPFEQLVRAIAPDRALGRHPLYQVMLTLVPAAPAPELAGLEVEEIASERATSPIDLTVFLEQRGDGYEAVWEYATDLFEPASIERMQAHFLRLLEAAIAAPDRPASELEMVTEAEREPAPTAASGAAAAYPVACLHELFEARAAAEPDAAAVVYEKETLSYRELNERANRLAHQLRELGVGPETLVALCLERSPELVVAILAVLKAGGAYVPLDPDYPAERLAFVLADARPRVLLTQQRLLDGLPAHEAEVVCVDAEPPGGAAFSGADPEPLARPENLAYVIYTSGSTGQPKGVQVEHRHVARLFSATDEWFGFGPEDTWVLLHSYAFDFSVWELWGALLHGGRLVVSPLWTTRSPQALADLIASERVTVLNATPTLFVSAQEELLRVAEGLRLRAVVFGGEALQPIALRPWFKRFGADGPALVNMYGITETTVHVTYRPLGAADFDSEVSPIGRPIPDLQLHLLDEGMRPVAPGVPGELFVGGAGVARGYLNRPVLTAERFLPNPFGHGLLYRSGDRARYRDDGELEFLGRLDDQVKIRGFRIELGEIQAAMLDVGGVREAAVIAVQEGAGDTRLAGYVVGDGTALGDRTGVASGSATGLPSRVRAHLEARLPAFMVPASISVLPRLPLTPNGKLDRRSLPAPVWEEQTGEPFVAPRTPTAARIAEIWQGILKVERVGGEDNFFALGGHSVLAARAVTRVREAFGIELSVRALFEHPTLDAFAQQVAAISGEASDEGAAAQPAAQRRTWPPAFSQRPLLVVDELAPEIATYNGAFAVRIRGPLDRVRLEAAIEDVVVRHEALRTVFSWEADEPAQVVLDRWPSALSVLDLRSLGAQEREPQLQRLLREHVRRRFDLRHDLMLRTTLFELGDEDRVLLVVTHHIASDGWSVGIFCRDLSELYNARLEGRSPHLPDLPRTYRDFAVWQRDRLQGERLERELAYWRTQLAAAPTILSLPSDRPRAPRPSFDGASLELALPGELAAGVLALCRETGATPYMLLLSVFGLLLYRLSGQDDILVGGPYANRTRTEFDEVIGFLANTLVMRVPLAGNPSFRDLLARVRETVLGALDHQEFPFEQIVEAVRPARHAGVNPLVQVNFRTRVEAPATLTLAGATASRMPLDIGFAAFELALDLHVLEDGIIGEFIYSTELFDRASVKRLADDFGGLLEQVLAQPDGRLLAFTLASEQRPVEAVPAGSGIRSFRSRTRPDP